MCELIELVTAVTQRLLTLAADHVRTSRKKLPRADKERGTLRRASPMGGSASLAASIAARKTGSAERVPIDLASANRRFSEARSLQGADAGAL